MKESKHVRDTLAAWGRWAYARPGLVPLVFCAANLARPAKLRAPNALMALLVAVAAQLAFDLGLEGCARGVVAPPAVVAGACIPLYLLLMHCAWPQD